MNETDPVMAHFESADDASLDAQETAANCPGFEVAPIVADYDDSFPTLSAEEEDFLIETQTAYEQEQAVLRGWLDTETNEPIDAYFALSDAAYDAARGA